MQRVIAVKGHAGARALLGAPSPVDVTVSGKRFARGYKVWTVGSDVAKSELYGWLRLKAPEGDLPYPPGYCHFPEYGEDYFKQLTAEHLVTHVDGKGFARLEWQLIPGRENHWLDCRVYARAAAVHLGLDRMAAAAAAAAASAAPETPRAPQSGGSDRFPIRGKSWLR